MEPIAGLQVVGQGRLSCQGRGVIARCLTSETLVLQAPLCQGVLGGNILRSFLVGENRGQVCLDAEHQLAELEPALLRPTWLIADTESKVRLHGRAGIRESSLVEQ